VKRAEGSRFQRATKLHFPNSTTVVVVVVVVFNNDDDDKIYNFVFAKNWLLDHGPLRTQSVRYTL